MQLWVIYFMHCIIWMDSLCSCSQIGFVHLVWTVNAYVEFYWIKLVALEEQSVPWSPTVLIIFWIRVVNWYCFISDIILTRMPMILKQQICLKRSPFRITSYLILTNGVSMTRLVSRWYMLCFISFKESSIRK